MKDKSAEYVSNGGWSSAHFAPNAIPLLEELKAAGVKVTVGRTVIHVNNIKAYVHHNGRSEEYATITDFRGRELATFHHTEFDALAAFIKTRLGL